MSEKYKFHDPDGLYFITNTVVDWIDVFTKDEYCEIIINSLKYCQTNKGLVVHAWVIMSNHLHMIISRSGNENLSQIVKSFKTFTSIEIIKAIAAGYDRRKKWMLEIFRSKAQRIKRVKNYKVWQDGSHPILLSDNLMIDQRLDYLHENPVKAGIVFNAEDYVNSSAIDYCGGRGQIQVDIIF
jgi:REP element-mobilizing transposase RayT